MTRSVCPNLVTCSLRFSLIVMFCVLSLTVEQASAQNVKKIERKLEDLVDRGHMMPRHAHAMLRTLHEMIEEEEAAWEEKHDDELDEDRWDDDEEEHLDVLEEKREYLQKKARNHRVEAEEIMQKIKQAVERGELSDEDARKKMNEVKQGVQQAHRELAEVKGALFAFELKEAVEDGELSEAEAHKKMEAMRRELKQQFEDHGDKNNDDVEVSLRQKREEIIGVARKRLKIALERGDITEQQAKERMEGMMQRFRQEDEKRSQIVSKLKEAEAKLKKAVESGAVTIEEARERMEEHKQKLIEEAKAGDQKTEHQDEDDNHGDEHDHEHEHDH